MTSARFHAGAGQVPPAFTTHDRVRHGTHQGMYQGAYHAAHDGAQRGVHHGADHGPAAPVPVARMGRLVRLGGAALSLGLLVGMVVWAVQLATRDASTVPVIRALDGPMRATPDDPGGLQAAHQGLAVNRLAEGAAAGSVPDRLVLAPPPVELVSVDLFSASRPAEVAPEDASTPELAAQETHELIQRLILRNQIADPAAKGMAMIEAPTPLAVPAPRLDIEVIPASIAGVAQSLRPMSRPATIAALAPTQAAAAAPSDLDPESLPAGTRLVQLGAFDSPTIAMAEWDRLTTRFPDFFAGRARVIQQASSGGADFYRLRAHGFDDLGATRRFCAALSAQNAPCIPVTVR